MTSTTEQILDEAVAAIAGTPRAGQQQMASAVADALRRSRHLLVQAGTGTGKSLAYLVPAVLHAQAQNAPVVVATATLALQAQLVDRDLPRLADVVSRSAGRPMRWATMKGRGNYACLYRVRAGVPQEQGELVDAAGGSPSGLGVEVLAARSWAEQEAASKGIGDRDRLEPGVSDRAWSAVSVSSRECIGAAKCPFGTECFAELAKDRARAAHVVVTNHTLLAIDAIEGIPVLPEHDVVIIDEGHELVSKVTSSATADLSPAAVQRAARRAGKGTDSAALEEAADLLEDALGSVPPGRIDGLAPGVGAALTEVAAAARGLLSELSPKEDGDDPGAIASRKSTQAALDEVLEVTQRLLAQRDGDVLWLQASDRFGPTLRVAPLSVAGLIAGRLLRTRTVVLTSATLKLGGTFDPVVRGVGLGVDVAAPVTPSTGDEPDRGQGGGGEPGGSGPGGSEPGGREPGGGESDLVERHDSAAKSSVGRPTTYDELDVGSPFDYERQGVLYLARTMPSPGRDGPSEELLAELVALVSASGGRTLGLFSSRRAAEQAAEHVRDRIDTPVLLQGDDVLPTLMRAFAMDPQASLFGTLSLWQGVDVPGPSCSLVTIDRIPFPRPDDPLMSARQRAVAESGGNGFMAVAATHAALLLAQGSGRLIRSAEDRGVVAVLDPRLATARYGAYLRDSMPAMWTTSDGEAVRAALARLDEAARADGR